MKDLRNQIDEIDTQLVHLLGKRMNLVREVAKFKKESDLPIIDEKREKELRKHLRELAKKEGLDEEFVNHLYTHIFIESRRIQED